MKTQLDSTPKPMRTFFADGLAARQRFGSIGRNTIDSPTFATTPSLNSGPSVAIRHRDSFARNPLRRAAFYCALALVFIRFSMLHQIISYVAGVNLRLLYIVGIPCLIGLLIAGGLRRALLHRTVRYWLLFAAWMVLSLPFSSWRSASLQTVASYLRTELPMLFVIAGLVVTWRECKLTLYVVAAASVVNIASSRMFGHADAGQRLSLDVGTVANSNDFAAHLLIVLPFLLWVLLSGRLRWIRLAALLGVGAGVYLILTTGSRGGAIALVAEVMLAWFLASGKHRIYIAVAGCLLVLVATVALPVKTLERILSVSANTKAKSEEALESEDSRRYLLKTSIRYTFEHPLFGVGPGQFANYEGNESVLQGKRGNWHQPHNAFTKASSECGIPALFFYLAAITSTMHLLGTLPQRNLRRSRTENLGAAVYCLRLAIIGHCVAIFFLNMTYFFYLPAMTGITIAIARASRSQSAPRIALSPTSFGKGDVAPEMLLVDESARKERTSELRP